jgi:hypothetical protein
VWLLAMTRLSPSGLRGGGPAPPAAEPFVWRRRLRKAGLAPEPVSLGLGSSWTVALDPGVQDGAGLRAAFLLRAEKRRLPLTPQRAAARLGWQPGAAA